MQQDLANMFWRFALALGLGLLVGLQRERVSARLAGLRTFPLVTLLGLLTGWISPLAVAAAFAALGLLAAVGYWLEIQSGDRGLTTEVTLLVMFGLGAYLAHGEPALAISMGAATAVLLQFKGELHGWAQRLTDVELKAMMQFALISMVILPALPDRAFGPYQVINPRHIWWMVVLIVAINLAAYLSYKFVESRNSAIVTGILGGLISSTATTASYARQAKANGIYPLATLVILISSGVVFARIMVEILVAAPALAPLALPRLAVPMLILAASAAAYVTLRKHPLEAPVAATNPAELKLAIVFGLGYSLVLLLAAAAKDWLGDAGLFAVAAVSGLTDVDAITLSTAQLYNTGRVDGGTAWRVVLTALLANMAFKLGLAGFLAGWPLLRRVAVAYALTAIAAAALYFAR
jgi:uncharacterized membrane protein (DUF4010 family)